MNELDTIALEAMKILLTQETLEVDRNVGAEAYRIADQMMGEMCKREARCATLLKQFTTNNPLMSVDPSTIATRDPHHDYG